MRKLLLVALLGCAANATAATAYLQSCTMSMSVTGQTVYVGTYMIGTNYFQRVFPMMNGYCPMSLEVY